MVLQTFRRQRGVSKGGHAYFFGAKVWPEKIFYIPLPRLCQKRLHTEAQVVELGKKIYHVWTDKDISEEDMQRIADGIELPDGEIHADAISYVSDTDKNQAGIEIHSGRNRIVRRIFEHLGYRVTKLDRVYFAGLTKKNLPRGRWRYLTQEEVTALRTGRFE